ncbi:hypothetical protein HZB03_01045 [Candidatus Woesearchaeota archaeon]|nr:hypothetical protein [Candidatus Woesearchaeota archaeon]
MTEEVINGNCKDYDNRVRFVQLIGNPELSRLEVLIFGDKSETYTPPKTQPSAYYKIIELSKAVSALTIPTAQPNNARLPKFRVSYLDNASGWYVPEEFKTIEHYMIQRFTELRFIRVHDRNVSKRDVNNKPLIYGAQWMPDCAFIGAMLEQFKIYCNAKEWRYHKRECPQTIQLNSGTVQGKHMLLPMKQR